MSGRMTDRTTMNPSPAEIAEKLSKAAQAAVRGAGRTVSGGTRVHWRHTCWQELEEAGLLMPRGTPSMPSSYLNETGLAVRSHLLAQPLPEML